MNSAPAHLVAEQGNIPLKVLQRGSRWARHLRITDTGGRPLVLKQGQ